MSPLLMDTLTGASYIVAILLGIAAIITSITYFRSSYKAAQTSGSDKIAQEALTNLQATVGALQTQNGLQANQLTTQDKKISELTGKVDTLSTIPLKEIEKHMADTNNILLSLTQLLPTLTSEHTVVDKTVTTKNSIQ